MGFCAPPQVPCRLRERGKKKSEQDGMDLVLVRAATLTAPIRLDCQYRAVGDYEFTGSFRAGAFDTRACVFTYLILACRLSQIAPPSPLPPSQVEHSRVVVENHLHIAREVASRVLRMPRCFFRGKKISRSMASMSLLRCLQLQLSKGYLYLMLMAKLSRARGCCQ